MEAILDSLIRHGYWILFAWVLLDQLALPAPALPMILAAGALAGQGHLDPVLCVALVVLACLPGNLFWYWLGIRRGNKVLTLLCMISLEPDTCISSTTSLFHRYGTASLVLSKFVPGLQTIAPPLAGLLGVGLGRFLLMNGLGSLLFAVVFLLPGYWAHELIAEIGSAVSPSLGRLRGNDSSRNLLAHDDRADRGARRKPTKRGTRLAYSSYSSPNRVLSQGSSAKGERPSSTARSTAATSARNELQSNA